MTEHSIGLSAGEILARLLTRRDIVRIGTATALAATPALLVARGGGNDALAQEASGTATAGDGSDSRPAPPVGSPQPQPTGPAGTSAGPTPGQASPVPGITIESFMDLSQKLVGGGRLDPERGSQLLALIAADPARRTALAELLAIRTEGEAATPIATPVAALSGGGRDLVEQILRFWYLGTYEDQPVTDRAGFWFSLSAWQAVGYTYAPSVCRAFGIWAQPPTAQS